jgi:hypothetical protein
MSIRYRVVRFCKQPNWKVVIASIRVNGETQSLPLTFKTIQQAQAWTDLINARDLVTGRRNRKPGRVKFKQHSIQLNRKTLDLDNRSRLKSIPEQQEVVRKPTSTITSDRLNAILRLSSKG